MVAKALQDHGFDSSAGAGTPQALREDPDLKASLASLQTAFDGLAPKLEKNSKDINKGRFSLGDSVADFPPGAQADALVFVRTRGAALTGGKQAFGILVAGPTRSRIDMVITVVDARSGEVLYLTKFFGLGNFVENPDGVLGKKVKNSIKKLRAVNKT